MIKKIKKALPSIILFALVIFGWSTFIFSDDKAPKSTRKTTVEDAKSGYEKRQKGEKLTNDEKDALDNYDKWEEKQNDK